MSLFVWLPGPMFLLGGGGSLVPCSFCLGESLSGGGCVRDTPPCGKERAVRILLECFLLVFKLLRVCSYQAVARNLKQHQANGRKDVLAPVPVRCNTKVSIRKYHATHFFPVPVSIPSSMNTPLESCLRSTFEYYSLPINCKYYFTDLTEIRRKVNLNERELKWWKMQNGVRNRENKMWKNTRNKMKEKI